MLCDNQNDINYKRLSVDDKIPVGIDLKKVMNNKKYEGNKAK